MVVYYFVALNVDYSKVIMEGGYLLESKSMCFLMYSIGYCVLQNIELDGLMA